MGIPVRRETSLPSPLFAKTTKLNKYGNVYFVAVVAVVVVTQALIRDFWGSKKNMRK